MKFLADENFPKPLVVKIRQFGYSIKTVKHLNLLGASDKVIANLAIKEKKNRSYF